MLLVFPSPVDALVVATVGVNLPYPAVIGLLVAIGVVFKQVFSEWALSMRRPVS
jgi:hypothetical protein